MRVFEKGHDKMNAYVSSMQVAGIEQRDNELMYARKISFTLLAPSIWPVLETAARQISEPGYSRYLMKTMLPPLKEMQKVALVISWKA